MTLKDTSNITSSAESSAGPTPCALPAGPQLDLFGQPPSPASRSARRASAGAGRTKDTSGRCSFGSSATAALQFALGSRLLAMTDTDGSPEYAMTWRRRAMQSGPPICRLLARARRTSGSGCSGWPTPKAQRPEQATTYAGGNPTLGAVAQLAGWGTPSARDGKDAGPAFEADPTIVPVDSRLARQAAVLAGWPTPMVGSPATEGYHEAGNTDSSRKAVALVAAGWQTPHGNDGECGPRSQSRADHLWNLPQQVSVTVSGPPSTSSPAPTARRGALNPFFSLYLMGYPRSWGVTGILSALKSKKK
jgi:hypothetical protein